jgi:hypothetical protein
MDIPFVRSPAAFFDLLPDFSSLFDLPRPSMTFAFTQFASLCSFRDLPPLFSTAFDGEEQIGPISDNIILPKKLQTIRFFEASYRRVADRGRDEKWRKSEKSSCSSPSLQNLSQTVHIYD